MKTGRLIMDYLTIDAHFVDGDIWLTKSQIAEFFGVFGQTIDGCFKSLFSANILQEAAVTKVVKSDKRQYILYNFELISCIGFRIRSQNAEIFRRWMIEGRRSSLLERRCQEPPIVIVIGTNEKSSSIGS